MPASFTLPSAPHETFTSTRPGFAFFSWAAVQHVCTRERKRFGNICVAWGVALPTAGSAFTRGVVGASFAVASASAPRSAKSSGYIAGPGHGSQLDASHEYSVTIAFG